MMKERKMSEELLEEFERVLTKETPVPSDRPQRSRASEEDGRQAAKAFDGLFQRDLKALK